MNSEENWDDISIVELFLKSLDGTEDNNKNSSTVDAKFCCTNNKDNVYNSIIKQEPPDSPTDDQLQCNGSDTDKPQEQWVNSNFDSLKAVPDILTDRIYPPNNFYQQFGASHLKFESSGAAYYCNQARCQFESIPSYSQQHMQQFVPDPKFYPQQLTTYPEVIVKTEPSEDTMDLTSHFMCHPMFLPTHAAAAAAAKCGCDFSKGQQHLLNKSTIEEYEELIKRGNAAALLGECHPKDFVDTSTLHPSQNIRSEKDRPFVCDECGKTFLLKHHLVTHTRVHTGLRPFGCSDCGKTFAHKHCLVTHQRLHSGQRPFQCLECKKSFTLKHHLVTHSRTHSKDRPFHCEECGRTFTQKRNLVTHAKLHSGERPFQCNICGECFSQREHLLAHSRFHGGESAFVCVDCGEAFARKIQLVDHRRQHGHSPYSCSVCGKEFLQKRTMLAHSKLHEGQGSYSCKHCNQIFPRMADLVAHSKIHNSVTCKDCNSSFQTNEEFVQHLQHHTNKTVFPKPYTCLECGTGFSQKHGLVQHMNRKHSQARDIMEHIKNQVLSEQLKAKIQ